MRSKTFAFPTIIALDTAINAFLNGITSVSYTNVVWDGTNYVLNLIYKP